MKPSLELINLLKSLRDSKKKVFLSCNQLDITFETLIYEADQSSVVLVNKIGPEHIEQMMSAGQYSLQCEMVRFESKKLTTDGLRLIFPLEESSIINETRTSERYVFSRDEKAFCHILNPVDRQTVLKKLVLDMSQSGLSIQTAYDSKLMSPGMKIDELAIEMGGQIHKRTKGTVVYRRKLMTYTGHLQLQVGIKFE